MAQLFETSLFQDASLVSYYRLENLSDSKGANTLTNTNSVAFSAAKYGLGADFSSSNSDKKLTTGNNLGIAGSSQAISITFWTKIYNTSAGAFVTHSSTTTADRYLIVRQDGSGNLAFLGAGNTGSVAFSDTTRFHHVVVTRDASGAILGYLDTVQVASFSAGSSGFTTNNFEIGDSNASDFGDHITDDVGIFSRVLTPTEILMLYQDTSGIMSGEI